jgi:hypothetical protein
MDPISDPKLARMDAQLGFIEMIIDFLTVKETDSFFVKFLRRLFLLFIISIIGIVIWFFYMETNSKKK